MFLAEVFKTYDKDGTGTLGENQLAPLLKALAGGVEPTPEEVQEVMDTADNDKSGAVSIDELKDVIRVWYVNAECGQEELGLRRHVRVSRRQRRGGRVRSPSEM